MASIDARRETNHEYVVKPPWLKLNTSKLKIKAKYRIKPDKKVKWRY